MRIAIAVAAILLATGGEVSAACLGDNPACLVKELRDDLQMEVMILRQQVAACNATDEHQNRMLDQLPALFDKLDERILAVELVLDTADIKRP